MKKLLLTLLLTALALAGNAAAQDATATEASAGRVAVITVEGNVTEQRNPLEIFAPATLTLRSLVDAATRAADDEGLDALMVRIQSPAWSLSQAGEFRDALLAFRATGRPLIVSADMLNMTSYYVASAGTEIALPEVGGVDLYGISLSLYYFRDMLEKIGVRADGLNTGPFKDAMDPFLRQEMSEGTREQYTALMNDLFDTVVDAVAAGRGVPREKAEQILTQGPYSSGGALEAGAIDTIASLDDLLDLVGERLGKEIDYDWDYAETKKKPAAPPSLMSLLMGTAGKSAARRAAGDRIALVYASGPIIDGRVDKSNPFLSTQAIASEDFIDLLDEVMEDGTTKALVLRVDSPGGSAIASDRIWLRLQRLREEGIPVVVSMGNVAASGGYYISMGADRIIAQPTTITGSIGVVGGKFTLGGTYDKIGVNRQRLSRGENSDIYSETTLWSDRERRVLEALLDDIYDTFTEKAAQGRGKTQDEIKALGGGRVWTGRAAAANGLADAVGGLDAAIAAARELANLPDAEIAEYPRELTFMETIEKLMQGKITVGAAPPMAISQDPWFRAAALLLPPGQLAHLAHIVATMRDHPTAMLVMPAVPEIR